MPPLDQVRRTSVLVYRVPLLAFTVGVTVILGAALALDAKPRRDAAARLADDKKADGENRVSVAIARERAMVMHDVYASTLSAMHHHYFHSNRSTLPARAMEDVFSDMAKKSKAEARWISVNTKAMSVDHEPETEFEKLAATAIAGGKDKFELVEKGYYHSATAIPLGMGCVSCHAGFFGGPPKSPRFAGLVISVPINEE